MRCSFATNSLDIDVIVLVTAQVSSPGWNASPEDSMLEA
jgi:hypothetical protein